MLKLAHWYREVEESDLELQYCSQYDNGLSIDTKLL
jgi:hypothetical protein